ncbi:MAG: NAD(P)/FAD-dependent oxidoreductase [Methanomassiliicoccales archaeon]
MLVIGAGPAGAAAAFFIPFLSEGKLSVLSLEKLDKNYGKYHRMCGEALSRKAFKDLTPLEPSSVQFRIRRAVEHWPGDVTIETDTDGLIIDRPEFLRNMLQRAKKEGCHTELGAAVEISNCTDGYLVRTRDGREFSAKYLVGADGWNSLVRRKLFQGSPRLLWAEQFITDGTMERDVMHFFYDERYKGGYRWEFPHVSGKRVGFTRGADKMSSYLERHGRPIPYGYDQVANGNACLIGDAAGQANPITFGGIRIGMAAAKMAAEAIVNGNLEEYARSWPRSPYASPAYVKAFDSLREMDNRELGRSVKPFRNGYGKLAMLKAMLSGKKYRELYRAYDLGAKWGW